MALTSEQQKYMDKLFAEFYEKVKPFAETVALGTGQVPGNLPPAPQEVFLPTKDALTALKYADLGMTYLGSKGSQLGSVEVARRTSQLKQLMEDDRLANIPEDMRHYGLMSGSLTAFDFPPSNPFVPAFLGVSAFNGLALQTYLNNEFDITGTPSS